MWHLRIVQVDPKPPRRYRNPPPQSNYAVTLDASASSSSAFFQLLLQDTITIFWICRVTAMVIDRWKDAMLHRSDSDSNITKSSMNLRSTSFPSLRRRPRSSAK